MSRTIPPDAELDFLDNAIVQLYSENDEGSKQWTYGFEDRSFRAHISQDSVEYRLLEADNIADIIASGRDIDRHYVSSESYFLSRFILSRAVRETASGEWIWHAIKVPTPKKVNEIADEIYVPAGAHQMPLVTQKPDRDNGRFTSIAINRALRDGYIPISTHPYYFMHDMQYHAEQMRAVDMETMSALQALASVAVSTLHEIPEDARLLANSIAARLDYYTFQTIFPVHVSTTADHLFEDIVKDISGEVDDDTEDAVKDILTGFGFAITDEGTVERPANVVAYNKDLQFAISQ